MTQLCRAFQRIGNQCEDVENNSTESWNKSIAKAREKALVSMLKTIARLAIRIAKRDVKTVEGNYFFPHHMWFIIFKHFMRKHLCVRSI